MCDCMALLLQASPFGLTLSPEISFSLWPPQEPQGIAAGWPARDHTLVSSMRCLLSRLCLLSQTCICPAGHAVLALLLYPPISAAVVCKGTKAGSNLSCTMSNPWQH